MSSGTGSGGGGGGGKLTDQEQLMSAEQEVLAAKLNELGGLVAKFGVSLPQVKYRSTWRPVKLNRRSGLIAKLRVSVPRYMSADACFLPHGREQRRGNLTTWPVITPACNNKCQ